MRKLFFFPPVEPGVYFYAWRHQKTGSEPNGFEPVAFQMSTGIAAARAWTINVEPQPLQSIFLITENTTRAVLPANRLLAKTDV